MFVKLRDCEIGAIVNSELKQRVRSVSGLTVHRPVMRQDVKLAAKLIQMLDERWSLWHDHTEEKKDKEKEVDSTFDVTQRKLYITVNKMQVRCHSLVTHGE